MSRGAALLFALLGLPVLASGRIAGTVTFKGRVPKSEKLKFPGSSCKEQELSGRAVLVRISKNAPPSVPPDEPIVIEQRDCVSRPFLQGAVKGQKVRLKNSDSTAHNVRAAAGLQPIFDVVQLPKAKELLKPLGEASMVKVTCELHPGVRSYVGLSDHGFFAVTADDGSFEIKDVPPGRYTVEAWHERLGTISAEVSVVEGAAVDPKFSFIGR